MFLPPLPQLLFFQSLRKRARRDSNPQPSVPKIIERSAKPYGFGSCDFHIFHIFQVLARVWYGFGTAPQSYGRPNLDRAIATALVAWREVPTAQI
jgi:hypothetical protein